MNNLIKKSFYSFAWLTLVTQSNLTSAMNLWNDKVQQWMKWTDNTADVAVQNLVGTLATFLTILAVLYALYWGFNILTAGWDDEKVSKWKTILIQALLWLLVIWLAYSVISWLVKLILPTA